MRVTCRVLPRNDSPTCDVQVVEEGGKSRVVDTFNCEADAWEWVTDQEHVSEICARASRKAPTINAECFAVSNRF